MTVNTTDRIYIYCCDEETGRRFLKDAHKQGIKFSDGSDPLEHHTSDIFRLYEDGTISYTGTAGHTLFHSSEEAIRVDYRKYIEGVQEYLM